MNVIYDSFGDNDSLAYTWDDELYLLKLIRLNEE